VAKLFGRSSLAGQVLQTRTRSGHVMGPKLARSVSPSRNGNTRVEDISAMRSLRLYPNGFRPHASWTGVGGASYCLALIADSRCVAAPCISTSATRLACGTRSASLPSFRTLRREYPKLMKTSPLAGCWDLLASAMTRRCGADHVEIPAHLDGWGRTKQSAATSIGKTHFPQSSDP